MLYLAAGAGLVAAGVWVLALPLIGVLERGHADDNALAQWNHGGSRALVGMAPETGAPAGGCGAAASAGSDAELTLITCTPWFWDDERIVWRAVLTP